MPIYEFSCKSCGNEFEELVNNNQITSLTCPKCSSADTHKKFSVFGGVHVKNPKQAACPSASACGASSSACASGGCSGHLH